MIQLGGKVNKRREIRVTILKKLHENQEKHNLQYPKSNKISQNQYYIQSYIEPPHEMHQSGTFLAKYNPQNVEKGHRLFVAET